MRMYFVTKILKYIFTNHAIMWDEVTLIWSNRNARKWIDSHIRFLFVSVSSLSSGLFIAMVLSLLFLVLLRFTAGVLFWIFIFGVIGIIGYGRCNFLASETIFSYCLSLSQENQ